ncbi:hypothetical protein Tco_1307260, partial [Tanacetum coccineum]
IMPPRMRTRSVGWPIAESLGGEQGLGANGGIEGVNGNIEGVNRGVGGALDFSMIIAQQLQNLLPAMLAQVGNQGNVGNQNGNVVNENVQENVKNVIVNGNWVVCSYKEFLACNPKEYDGKGGPVVLTQWIEKIEYIRKLSREVVVSMSWNDFKFMMIEEFCPSHEMQKLETELWNHAMVGAGHVAYINSFHEMASALTDEAFRNGSIKKVEKRGNMGEHSKDKNGRDDNKRTRTENAFATTINPVGRENMGVPRNVNPINARNLTVRACYECGSTDHGRGNQGNKARGRAFMLGSDEARQDPKIMMGTFTLNNHFATTLFDSGAEYSFVSTTFIPLLGLEPSELGFKYEIEIASEKLVKIDKSIRRETRRESEFFIGAKAGDKKQEEIVVVRDFPEVFSDDLSGLPPIGKLSFELC